MVFRAIVQADTGDPDGELRLGDRLWVLPPDLNADAIGSRLVMLAGLVRAERRVGLASKAWTAGTWRMTLCCWCCGRPRGAGRRSTRRPLTPSPSRPARRRPAQGVPDHGPVHQRHPQRMDRRLGAGGAQLPLGALE